MFLTKISEKTYQVRYPSDEREDAKIKVGSEVKCTHSRNAMFHRKGFSLLNLLFSNQDKYSNIDIYRQILTIKAGFVTWVKGDNGVEYPFAMSWSFEKMSQEDFEKLYSAILEVGSKEIGVEGSAIEAELAGYY